MTTTTLTTNAATGITKLFANKKMLTIVIAAVVLALLAAAALTVWLVTRPPSLQKADADLYDQIVAADDVLAQDVADAPRQTGFVTTVPADLPADAHPWQSVVLATDDPAVTAFTALVAQDATLHAWTTLYTDAAKTKVVDKNPSVSFPDYLTATDIPATAMITAQEAQYFLQTLTGQHDRFQAGVAALATALATAQKAATQADHDAAATALETAVGNATGLLQTSEGQVADDATRQALSAVIDAAQAVLQVNGLWSLTDLRTAAEAQASTDALTAALPAFDAPTAAVQASQQAKADADAAAAAAAAEAERQRQQAANTSPAKSSGSSSKSSGSGSSSSSSSHSSSGSSGGSGGSSNPGNGVSGGVGSGNANSGKCLSGAQPQCKAVPGSDTPYCWCP
ncbi:MAG: hypothetical protein LBI33_00335 [Propionibacteriaceae bacterium]|jgi:hypothetical protein|nr:hypothetical protein [Propionibacteriaceae bacterium]